MATSIPDRLKAIEQVQRANSATLAKILEAVTSSDQEDPQQSAVDELVARMNASRERLNAVVNSAKL